MSSNRGVMHISVLDANNVMLCCSHDCSITSRELVLYEAISIHNLHLNVNVSYDNIAIDELCDCHRRDLFVVTASSHR